MGFICIEANACLLAILNLSFFFHISPPHIISPCLLEIEQTEDTFLGIVLGCFPGYAFFWGVPCPDIMIQDSWPGKAIYKWSQVSQSHHKWSRETCSPETWRIGWVLPESWVHTSIIENMPGMIKVQAELQGPVSPPEFLICEKC